jgi:hypothetical protein
MTPNGCLNLWRSFAVDPVPGDWSLMGDHILKVICRGDPERGDYFLNWLARMVQYPEEPGRSRSSSAATRKALARASSAATSSRCSVSTDCTSRTRRT